MSAATICPGSSSVYRSRHETVSSDPRYGGPTTFSSRERSRERVQRCTCFRSTESCRCFATKGHPDDHGREDRSREKEVSSASLPAGNVSGYFAHRSREMTKVGVVKFIHDGEVLKRTTPSGMTEQADISRCVAPGFNEGIDFMQVVVKTTAATDKSFNEGELYVAGPLYGADGVHRDAQVAITGKPRIGESDIAGVQRELAEEIGLTISDTRRLRQICAPTPDSFGRICTTYAVNVRHCAKLTEDELLRMTSSTCAAGAASTATPADDTSRRVQLILYGVKHDFNRILSGLRGHKSALDAESIIGVALTSLASLKSVRDTA